MKVSKKDEAAKSLYDLINQFFGQSSTEEAIESSNGRKDKEDKEDQDETNSSAKLKGTKNSLMSKLGHVAKVVAIIHKKK